MEEELPPRLELIRSITEFLVPENLSESAISWILTIACVLFAIILVILFVAFGWWIVWKCFLSRFKFVRELLCSKPAEEEEIPRKRDSRKTKST